MGETLKDQTENPLQWFYRAAGATAPPFETLTGETMPEPYRGLLVHERDMTSTLESFVGQSLALTVLQSHAAPDCLYRRVVLVGVDDGTLAEFGAIRIFVDSLCNDVAEAAVREGERPLGGILREHGIVHRCQPLGFFQVRCDTVMGQIFNLPDGHLLFGRHNLLYGPGDAILAEATEVLPSFPIAS